jgi:hypothetical protein
MQDGHVVAYASR